MSAPLGRHQISTCDSTLNCWRELYSLQGIEILKGIRFCGDELCPLDEVDAYQYQPVIAVWQQLLVVIANNEYMHKY